MAFKFGVGCCCGPDCVVFRDDFNRDDSTDLGPDWTQESGSWEIEGNTLKTSSSNAVVYVESPFGANSFSESVAIKVKAMSDGDVVVIGDPDLINTSYFVELKFGDGSYIGQKSSGLGIEARTSQELNTNTWYTIKLSDAVYLDGVQVPSFYGVGWNETEDLYLCTKTIAGSVFFDDVTIAGRPTEQCPLISVTCPWFVGDIPDEITVVIENAGTNGVYDYTGLNGTYTLARDGISCNYLLNGLSISYTNELGSTDTCEFIVYDPGTSSDSPGAFEIITGARTVVGFSTPFVFYRTDAWDIAGNVFLGDEDTLIADNTNESRSYLGTATISY